MSQLESLLKQRNERLEAEGLAAAAEISTLKSSIASQRKRHEAQVLKLEADLRASIARIERLERELKEAKDRCYPLPTGVVVT